MMECQTQPKASVRLLPFPRARAAEEEARQRQTDARNAKPLPPGGHDDRSIVGARHELDLQPLRAANRIEEYAPAGVPPKQPDSRDGPGSPVMGSMPEREIPPDT